jgi:hypothetical protein
MVVRRNALVLADFRPIIIYSILSPLAIKEMKLVLKAQNTTFLAERKHVR